MTEIQKLFEDAAAGLTSKPVRVIFRIPASKNADGIAYLQYATGEPIIEIKPGLKYDRAIYVLLHEAAHHYLGHCGRSTACYQKSGSKRSNPDTKAERSTVNDQVGVWQVYAEANKNQYEGTDQERRLKALAFWRFDQMIGPIVERAAEKAARKALADLPIIR